jgi:hypothetical protein
MHKLAEQEEERKLKSVTQVGPLLRMAMACVHEAKQGGYQTRQLKGALQQRMEADMSYAYELAKVGRTYSTLQTRWVAAASKTEQALEALEAVGADGDGGGDAVQDVSEEELLQALLVVVGGSFECIAETINDVNHAAPAPQQAVEVLDSVFEQQEEAQEQELESDPASVASSLKDLDELAAAVEAQAEEPAIALEYLMEVDSIDAEPWAPHSLLPTLCSPLTLLPTLSALLLPPDVCPARDSRCAIV